MKRDLQSIAAFAPGGVGNIGPGLDILGLALAGPGDTVRAEWTDQPGIQIRDPGHPDLPRDPARHTSGLAALAVIDRAGDPRCRERGIALTIEKGLPLSGGQGGSAASAVAGAVAANALLGGPLDRLALITAALAAEEQVSGRHADNIAPALLGGIVLIRSLDPLDLVQLPVPEELWVVVARPNQQLRTAEARSVLPAHISRAAAVHQAAQVGAMVAALASGDYALLGRAIDDRIAEPVRTALLPGFREAKRAALEAGALGSSISGSGPTAFALVRGLEAGERVAKAMSAAYTASGHQSDVRVARIDREGARVIGGAGRETR
ncbi:MAG TPA: homoserine kinase [Gemmatimonadales bacterium]|nr:homoserine kinase [Gemmatimonadales bacterium]